MTQAIVTVENLKKTLFLEQQKHLVSFLWDEDRANKFLGAVVYCFQAVPKLAECSQESIVSAFMKCAEINIFPSSVSGLAYVLPYKGKAQFQLGYKGIVELFYRSGVKDIRAEIVRKHDIDNKNYSEVNGVITHTPDVFNPERRKTPAVWAYVIITLVNGGVLSKSMDKDSILDIGSKFSQSFWTDFTPWKEKNDPELWMWKKTVLKQLGKLVPQNETIMRAIDYDNEWDTDFSEIQKNQMLERANRPSEWNVADLLNPPAPFAPPPVVEWANIVPPTPTTGTIADAV